MSLRRAMPVPQVSDMAVSTAFWRRMGFDGEGWSDDALGGIYFTIARRGEVSVALQLLRGAIPANTHWAAYIYVADVAALRAEFVGSGLEPTEIRHPQHYGCDDFDIRDPDGHLVAFGQPRELAAAPA